MSKPTQADSLKGLFEKESVKENLTEAVPATDKPDEPTQTSQDQHPATRAMPPIPQRRAKDRRGPRRVPIAPPSPLLGANELNSEPFPDFEHGAVSGAEADFDYMEHCVQHCKNEVCRYLMRRSEKDHKYEYPCNCLRLPFASAERCVSSGEGGQGQVESC